jgi:hypothetical protein
LCDKYGEGNPWCLNPKNYALEDAKKMVEIAKPIARIDCICRRRFEQPWRMVSIAAFLPGLRCRDVWLGGVAGKV